MKDYRKIIIAFILSQIITINNFFEMKYLYNEDISLVKSTSVFLFCIYYFYVFFGILMRKNLIKYFSKKDNINSFRKNLIW